LLISAHNAFVAESYRVIREIAVKVLALRKFALAAGAVNNILKFRRDLSNRKQDGGIINSVGPTVDVIEVVTLFEP
jgi:hypothetical protein